MLEKFLASRFGALLDKSAWLLIGPAFLALFFIDAAMAKTLFQWTIFGIVLAGASVIISRLVFPQIRLTSLVDSAHTDKNTAAGIIVAAIILFVGIVMMSLVLWAKA